MLDKIETDLVETTKALFANTLRVGALPSAMNVGLLKAMIPTAPAVYWAFLGGKRSRAGGDPARIDGRWVAYIITRHVGNTDARRHGDQTTIGAYEVIKRLVPAIHGHVIQDVGSLDLADVNNLFSMQLEESYKAALYAISFSLPNLEFEIDTDLSSLDDFVTFHDDYDLDLTGDGEPMATDHVTLPQE